MKLFALVNSVWDADDFLNSRNTDPRYHEYYLFTSKEECEKKALQLYCDADIYNETFVYEGELSNEEIKELSGVSTPDFKKMLKEPYSTSSEKNWGEDEKTAVAQAIVDEPEYDYPVDAANYDFDKSLEGSILVFWEWRTYVGYARKCLEVRYADEDDTEAILTKQDHTFVSQCSVLLTAEEVRNAKKQKKLYLAVLDELQQDTWKWTNPSYAESQAEQFE